MNAPLLLLKHNSPIPPYEQIRVQMCLLIISGQLRPGDQLPSIRQLARDLGVAPNTVVRAYNELEHEGWVVISARRSISVALHPPSSMQEEYKQKLELAVTQLLVTAHQIGASIGEIHDEINRQTDMINKELVRDKGEGNARSL